MQLIKTFALLLLCFAACCAGNSLANSISGQPVSFNRTNPVDKGAHSDDHLRPEQFGAKGNGSDDTAAFQAMHTAIQFRGFGRIVLQPGKTYGINGKTGGVLFKISNLSGYEIDAGSGATIKDLRTYQRGENAIAFMFINCKNIKIGGKLKLISQAYSPGSNETGLSWFKFVSGCRKLIAEVDIDGGLHGFHFYRNYGEPFSSSSSDIKLTIKANKVYYPELHERSGEHVETRIDSISCGRAFFIYGGGNNINAIVTTRNCYGFLISSDSAGNGAENISIDYRDRDSNYNKGDARADAGRCGLQFNNQNPATFRNIRIKLDLLNPTLSPFSDSFYIIKLNNAGGRDSAGRGHRIDGLDISGISEQINGRKHITTYGAFAAPDQVRNIIIHDFKGTGAGSDILLDLSNALSDTVLLENVALPKNSIRIIHSTGQAAFR